MDKSILDFWPFIISIVAVIVWLTRLEAKVLYLENLKKDLEITIRAMAVEHDELKTKMYDQLSVIQKTLTRLETILSMKLKE